jgi:signal transduction histidine kinase
MAARFSTERSFKETLLIGLRISTVRLALLLGLLFIVANVALLGLVYWQTSNYLASRVDDNILLMVNKFKGDDEAKLAAQVNFAMTYDLRKSNLYGLFAPDGKAIVGNMKSNPLAAAIDDRIHEFPYGDVQLPNMIGAPQESPGLARAIAHRLSNGDVLVVGRDFTQMVEIKTIVMRALYINDVVIVLISLIGACVLTIRPLRKIKAIREASQRIIQGEISLRMPVSTHQDEIDMLASTVNLMLDEVERLMNEIKSVTDALAHNLRTPLTHLRFLIERARNQADAQTEASLQPILDDALFEMDFLLRRFRALLRISEIERRQRRSRFTNIDPGAMFERIADLFEPLAEDKSITLRVDCEAGAQIYADGDLLFEALYHLVDNSIKFTSPDGNVQVRFSHPENMPRIEVIDSGCGFSTMERDSVLNRMHGNSRHRELEGCGLGLCIVAAILNLHGFTMDFQAQDIGTHVTILCAPATVGA